MKAALIKIEAVTLKPNFLHPIVRCTPTFFHLSELKDNCFLISKFKIFRYHTINFNCFWVCVCVFLNRITPLFYAMLITQKLFIWLSKLVTNGLSSINGLIIFNRLHVIWFPLPHILFVAACVIQNYHLIFTKCCRWIEIILKIVFILNTNHYGRYLCMSMSTHFL